ncbi:MAG TPA: ABC transporter permease [Bryobacteraceae bacterium]|nr:ABC transporter permease [Bryobacteraceae bacterium]
MRKFWNLLRRGRMEQDLERELRYHLERRIADFRQGGLSEAEARRRAPLEFGGMAQVQEDVRDTWWWRWLRDLARDLRYAARVLSASPGFTATAVLSLALGIGATTAIFTLIDAVLLKMLPVKNPQELVLLRWAVPKGQQPLGKRWYDGNSDDDTGRYIGTSFSYNSYRQIRTLGTGAGRPLADVLGFTGIGDVNVLANGEATLAYAQVVSANYFAMLGVRPAIGRTFVEGDDVPGAPAVCVISDAYWKRKFGADRSIAGKAIAINGAAVTILGVTPPEFFGLQPGWAMDISLPLTTQPPIMPRWDPKIGSFLNAPDHWWMLVMGRLNPGVPSGRAQALLDTVFKQSVTETYVPSPKDEVVLSSLDLAPGGPGIDELRRQFSRPLLILMGMVGLVLLIACANVANLLLARATARQREIGIRLSIGASRGRLIRQLLTESVLLASAGGAAGCLLAWWGSHVLVALISTSRYPVVLNINPDLRLLGFAAAACLFTGLLFGLAPALRATRVDLTPSLKRTRPGARGAGARLTLGQALVIAQTALSVVLVFGAGLFVRTLVNLQNLNTGFQTGNVLLFGVNALETGYKGQALNDFYERVRQRVAALPGAISATATYHLLLSGSSRGWGIDVPGYTPKPGESMSVRVVPAGADFFKTMRIPLLRGRDFTERDTGNAPKVAVVNETFVKHYFAGRDPIGQRIGWAGDAIDMAIVGVAGDAKYDSLRRAAPATLYHPFQQAPRITWMHFEVRTAGDPKALIPAVRRAVASLDRNLPLFDVKTQTEQIDELLLQERLFARLSGSFGLLALVLAWVGLYGVLSYAVARRAGEIGIRMALGAPRGKILRMVLRDVFVLAGAGLVLGIPASLAAARLAAAVISDLLYGLKGNDAISLAIASTALLLAAACAGFLPARRASLVDPVTALREE